MKKTVFALVALLGLSLGAHAAPPAYRTTVVRVTPGASPAYVLAFQNTSSDIDVEVHRVVVSAASTMTVTSGAMQFWVYVSTSLTHSAAAGKYFSHESALASQPSYISASTAPLSVQLEGDSGILTAAQRHSVAGALPVIRPIHVNPDEGATGLFDDASDLSTDSADSWTASGRPIKLPRGSNRAIVIEKRQLASSDFTDGQVYLKIVWVAK